MATYQKRGKAWRAIVRKHGASASRSFDTKAAAVKWATALEAKLDSGEQETIACAIDNTEEATVSDLFTRYADTVSPKKRGARWEEIRLKRLARDKEFDKAASKFTGQDMAAWRDARLKQVATASVCREMNLVSSVFTTAIREWGLNLPANPCSLISRPKQPRARTQRVSIADRNALVRQLGWDMESKPSTAKQAMAAAFCFALETAMRKGEVLSLDWGDIHKAEKYARLDMTKNGEERNVPLSNAAFGLLAKLGGGAQNERIFNVGSGNLDKEFRAARKATGLMHVRFHDSRREATTNIAGKLSNVLELAAVTGHKDLKMLKIYFAPSPADLAKKMG